LANDSTQLSVGGGGLGQSGGSFQALITTLANNQLQNTALWQMLIDAINGLGAVVAVPANSAAPGAVGQIAVDATHFYFYTGTQWLRVTGSTF